ncbi:hypothetical protein F4810DRAFT_35414 [Camillea tinctor]|nr:hypothetical protein F4810DRAFT_35414 [Camillea tinctor]
MSSMKNLTFRNRSHSAQELKARVLETSCWGYQTRRLEPSQRRARAAFLTCYKLLHEQSELSAKETLPGLMGLLDQFFFFGTLTVFGRRREDEPSVRLRIKDYDENDTPGTEAYFDRGPLEITLYTTVSGEPVTLDRIIGSLCHEMTHAYLDIFCDPRLTPYEEVEAHDCHGTVFTELCLAIQHTVRGWSLELSEIDVEDRMYVARGYSQALFDDRFVPYGTLDTWQARHAAWMDRVLWDGEGWEFRVPSRKEKEFHQPSLLD